MTNLTNPRAVVCSKCQAIVGYYEEHDGRVYIHIGILSLRYFGGVCQFCGQEIIHQTTDKTLERLFERRNRVMKLEKGEVTTP